MYSIINSCADNKALYSMDQSTSEEGKMEII